MAEFETSGGNTVTERELDGVAKISEAAVASLAMKAVAEVDGVKPATPGFITGFRLGRKTVDAVRVNVSYDDAEPEIIVDAYVSVRYGLRLPDVCWDLQENVKKKLEKETGYAIKAVNVYVSGIDFSMVDKHVSKTKEEETPSLSAH